MKFHGSNRCLAALLWTKACDAFVPWTTTTRVMARFDSTDSTDSSVLLIPTALPVASNEPDRSVDFSIPLEKVRFPILKIGKGRKQKVLNLHGAWCAIASLMISPFWILAMTLVDLYGRINKKWDPHRSLFDRTGKIWAKAWLALNHSYPTKSGNVQQLKGKGIGPCLYVANHAAWLDIPILCTVLEPVFKFIAKGDLRKIPGIGQQLTGGRHILIDREDRRSQLKTFKDGIGWLKQGVPLMAFPEGTRSKDGRLMNFKGGVFSMAIKAGVPVVPLTISNAHAVWPTYGLLPIQWGHKKLHVHVHDPIQSKDKTEAELSHLVREAFLSTLPDSQQPLANESKASNSTSDETQEMDA